MTDRPIIFSAPMVRALLEGRKTMTRRLASSPLRKCAAGDRLWVRETWGEGSPPIYRSDLPAAYDTSDWGWRPSIHMPRSASRLTLVVTAMKVEPLADITAADCFAEGCEMVDGRGVEEDGGYRMAPGMDLQGSPQSAFMALWELLHGEVSYRDNPEVVALTFTVERRNIDA